jgi:putative hydrolase of the HAD superfamily
MFAAVLFDLDDTLIADEPATREAFITTALEVTRDEERAQTLAQAALLETKGMWAQLPAAAAAYAQRIGHSAFEGLWATYDARIAEEATLERETAKLRPEAWARALKTCGETGDGAAMARRFIHLRAQFPLYVDTNAVLARLRPVTKLGIVTNGVSGLQRQKLNGSGLLHWFDAVAVSGEVGIGKPERGVFDFIAGQLGVDVKDCVMVGDNPERDIQGGLNAGMQTIWLDRGLRSRTVQAHFEAKSLNAAWEWMTARC